MIRIHSIFESISGEAGFFLQGSWCTFIRLQGCNLRCRWCDTKQAQKSEGGKLYEIEDVVNQCKTEQVLITGGEPLLQSNEVMKLTGQLITAGHDVQIETNGSFPIPEEFVDDPVYWVVDYKCPSSGVTRGMPEPATFAKGLDTGKNSIVKFVVANEVDTYFALAVIKQMEEEVGYFNTVIISPLDAEGVLLPRIIKIIKEVDKGYLNRIIFSIQIHKITNQP